MKTKTFKQTIEVNASPKEIYDTWLSSKGHSKMIKDKAKTGNKVGDKLSMWGGYIIGENVELVEGKLIKQNLRFEYDDWDKEYMSVITLKFSKGTKGKTKILFTHSKVPTQHADDLKQGWIDNYWNKLKAMFDK
jgi:activator of HSP90 ATPase